MADPFRWTARKQEAALQIATFATPAQVAADLGVAESTVKGWFAHPDFKARVEELKSQIRLEKMNVRIADAAERIQILDALQKKYLDLIEARAEGMAGEVEGASTGLLVRKEKYQSTGGGSYVTYTEYEADTAVTAEIRALQDLAAKDLGQRVEKKEMSAQIGIRREFVLIDNSDDPPLTEAELNSLPDADTIDADFEEIP
jgi:hypothetical protein